MTATEDTIPADDAAMSRVTARAGYMMGENVDRAWTPEHARAWEGFLELGRQLRRAADGVLEPVDGLTVSMLGIMGRLARAERRTLRQTDIAAAMGLSVSRISRLIDTLESRGLVERRPGHSGSGSDPVSENRALLAKALGEGDDPEMCCIRALADVVGDHIADDDIAILVARLDPADTSAPPAE